jgi:hypothetical protein
MSTNHNLLLNFYSSELNSHSRLIIGNVALLFTLAQIIQSFGSNITSLQYWIFCLGLFTLSSTFWYLLMRLLLYGILSNRVLHVKDLGDFKEMHKVVGQHCGKTEKIFGIIPCSLFISIGLDEYNNHQKYGLLLCLSLALIVTFLFALILV